MGLLDKVKGLLKGREEQVKGRTTNPEENA